MAEADDPLSAYAAAGVNVAAGDALVDTIKPFAAATKRPGAVSSLGGFGAAFDLKAAGHGDSVLIASTDGVGTKLRLATDLGDHTGVGIDLVAMCVNDILAQGAEPLFFLDYYATGALDVAAAATVIKGIAAGCELAGCALIGGETAEMPGHYAPGDYDLAGFAVGAAPRERLLPRPDVAAGDVLIALPSAGVHSNGFSLVRKLAADGRIDYAAPFGDGTVGAALLKPTRIYVKPVLAALRAEDGAIKGIAHITGGGLTGNVPRMLPEGLAAAIDRAALPVHPLMTLLKAAGDLSDGTMEATFNCGTGLVLAVAAGREAAVMDALAAAGESPALIGSIVAGGADEAPCRIR